MKGVEGGPTNRDRGQAGKAVVPGEGENSDERCRKDLGLQASLYEYGDV